VHGGGINGTAAVDKPAFVACVLLLPAVVGGVRIDLAAAEGVMLRAHSVLEPHGLGGAANANHGERAMGATKRAVIDLANDERAGLANSGGGHLLGGWWPLDRCANHTPFAHHLHTLGQMTGWPISSSLPKTQPVPAAPPRAAGAAACRKPSALRKRCSRPAQPRNPQRRL
jgi:hypothetical protein